MILLQEFFSVVGVNRNVHDIPCFAILTNGTEKKPTLANPNIPPGALYLEHLHQIEKFEARSDIKVFILKKNGTFMPSNPIRQISSTKVILMLAEEDWLMVTLTC